MGQSRTLNGARILITGASQGIGRCLALGALARGAKVIGTARNMDRLQAVVTEAHSKGWPLIPLIADVTVPEDRQKMVDAAMQHFGGLDILVNNAGVGATGHFSISSPERLRKIMEINFFGLAETTRVFIPILKKGTKAAIVNISSVSGKRGIPAQSEYSASKFAVQGFSEALRAELAKDAIDVLVVNPGLTNTDFPKNMIEQTSRQNLGTMRTDTPESVADRTLVALEKGKDEITLTRLGKFIVLMNRLFPSMANRIAKKRVLKLYKDEIEARKKEESK